MNRAVMCVVSYTRTVYRCVSVYSIHMSAKEHHAECHQHMDIQSEIQSCPQWHAPKTSVDDVAFNFHPKHRTNGDNSPHTYNEESSHTFPESISQDIATDTFSEVTSDTYVEDTLSHIPNEDIQIFHETAREAGMDFVYSDIEEPHAARRREILAKYPQIKELMRPEPRTKWMVLVTVLLQIFMAVVTVQWEWGVYLLTAYVVGATANHSLFLAIHEISHNLASYHTNSNKLLAMFANVPIVIPYCFTFKPFHLKHHRALGHTNEDTDLPTFFEAWLLTKSSTCYADHCARKALYMFAQVLAYAFRPMLVSPHMVRADRWVALNWATQLSVTILFIFFFGTRPLLYLLLSTFLAGSIHPTAGHFVAEHYQLSPNTVRSSSETFSYYGPLNYLTYNVGFHNEHHDFPNIPWSGLPRVRAIAPEFYNSLPQCSSWPGAIIQYIFNDNVSPMSRIRREHIHTE